MGDGGASRARRQARRDAARYEADMRRTEAENQKRLAEIQAQNQQQQAAMEATMQANVSELTREPTTFKRRKRKKPGAKAGLEKLRIAKTFQGSSTNLG